MRKRASSWTPERDQRLREVWMTRTMPQLAELFLVDESTVRRRARDLDLPSKGIRNGAERRAEAARPKTPIEPAPQGLPTQWPDGWTIRRPSMNQLMAGR